MAVILGVGLGTLILFFALVWGVRQYNRRNRANEPITDAATKELYRNPDRYAERTEAELKSKLQ